MRAHSSEIDASYASIGVRSVVCNGTHPGDWDAVLQLAQNETWLIPAIGLHP